MAEPRLERAAGDALGRPAKAGIRCFTIHFPAAGGNDQSPGSRRSVVIPANPIPPHFFTECFNACRINVSAEALSAATART